MPAEWVNVAKMAPKKYQCGYCGQKVGSDRGWYARLTNDQYHGIYICPYCGRATFFDATGGQVPQSLPGNRVANVPKGIRALYDESRAAVSASAYTASVLTSRKLLMHIAVEKGAPASKKFIEYVDYLATNGYVPPNGRDWVDHIRARSNEANHEIILMSRDDAMQLVDFLEMLLKFIFEFPGRITKKTAKPAGAS